MVRNDVWSDYPLSVFSQDAESTAVMSFIYADWEATRDIFENPLSWIESSATNLFIFGIFLSKQIIQSTATIIFETFFSRHWWSYIGLLSAFYWPVI